MEDFIYHNSHNLDYRAPFGAVGCEQQITLQLAVAKRVEVCYLHYWLDGADEKQSLVMNYVKKNDKSHTYQIRINSSDTPGLLWYFFVVHVNGRILYYGNNSRSYGGEGQLSYHSPLPYQITVYKHKYLPPKWFMESIMYQVFVDRFHNGNTDNKVLNPKKNSLLHSHWANIPVYIKDDAGRITYWDFFGGNLLGVKKKLSYLKELGISNIYFNPIFEAPSNHKYDTGDYHQIDPMFGDNQSFKELASYAKELGIYLILDGVFSHTGSDSIYFNKEASYDSLGAFQSMKSKYYNWYRFTSFPNCYECWWGIDVLPNVNELEPSYQNFIIYDDNSVLKYWQSMGVKGWRLDVADELPDSFIQGFNLTMKEMDKDAVLIGEVWEDASNKLSYDERRKYLIEDELDSVTNYPFRLAVIDFLLGFKDAGTIDKILLSLYENYPLSHFYSLMNLLGSHDTPRILSVLQNNLPDYALNSQEELAIMRLKLASLWQMTFPGVPVIFYGDEAGVEGVEEPLNRKSYPWGKENLKLINWYKQITKLRNSYDVFKTGSWQSFFYRDDVYGYLREIKNGKDIFLNERKDNIAIVLLNRSIDTIHEFSFNTWEYTLVEINYLYDYYTKEQIWVEKGTINIKMQPLESKVFVQYL